jgi:hypothetical protein
MPLAPIARAFKCAFPYAFEGGAGFRLLARIAAKCNGMTIADHGRIDVDAPHAADRQKPPVAITLAAHAGDEAAAEQAAEGRTGIATAGSLLSGDLASLHQFGCINAAQPHFLTGNTHGIPVNGLGHAGQVAFRAAGQDKSQEARSGQQGYGTPQSGATVSQGMLPVGIGQV